MNRILILTLLYLIGLCIVVYCQKKPDIDKDWIWIVPLKTQKNEVEKVFGQSITKDKNNPLQTYLGEFGKITVTYARKHEFVKECSCVVGEGTVLETFVSPKRFKLSELRYDLTKFKKDDTYSPRELSYYSETEGILIATEIVQMPDKTAVERVIAIEYRPKRKLCL